MINDVGHTVCVILIHLYIHVQFDSETWHNLVDEMYILVEYLITRKACLYHIHTILHNSKRTLS